MSAAVVVAKSGVTDGVCDTVSGAGEGCFGDANGDGEQSKRSGQFHDEVLGGLAKGVTGPEEVEGGGGKRGKANQVRLCG